MGSKYWYFSILCIRSISIFLITGIHLISLLCLGIIYFAEASSKDGRSKLSSYFYVQWPPKYFQIFLLLNAKIHLILSHYFSVISFFNVVKFKVSSKNFTSTQMLQKLSKCELKAWICWNLIILQPLIFYVKSNLGELEQSKNVIFGNFRGSEFWFSVNLSNF